MMKEKFYLKNTLLAAELAVVCLAVILMRTFSQGTLLVRYDVPFMVLMSVIPMIINCYLKNEAEENRIVSALLAGLFFTVLPYCAGWDTGMAIWKVFAEGTIVFGVTDMFCSSIGRRVSSGPKAPALAANGVLLYLAVQCFQSIF